MYSAFITPNSLSPAAKRSGSIIVTVFGGARVAPDSKLYEESVTLGRLLGQAGYVVATGGYTGTMEAVLRGAAEAGAHTIGYTCETFEASSEPNGWIKDERKTPTLTARIQRMADESDAFVVVHGHIPAEEEPVGHSTDSGHKRSEGAYDWHETRQENGLAAILLEEHRSEKRIVKLLCAL